MAYSFIQKTHRLKGAASDQHTGATDGVTYFRVRQSFLKRRPQHHETRESNLPRRERPLAVIRDFQGSGKRRKVARWI